MGYVESRAAKAVRWFAASMLCAWTVMPASAQVWGYVDPTGAVHFASEKLDDRYDLFYSGQSADPGVLGEQPDPAAAALQMRLELSISYKAVRHLIREAAEKHGLDQALLKAVVATESGFDSKAVSPKGAIGLMQVMPDTAQRFGVKPTASQTVEQRLTDARINLNAGARYLAWLMRRFKGDVALAVAAYNAGEGAVQRYGNKVPPFPETQRYVATVTRLQAYLQPPKILRQPWQGPARATWNDLAFARSGARSVNSSAPAGTLTASNTVQPYEP